MLKKTIATLVSTSIFFFTFTFICTAGVEYSIIKIEGTGPHTPGMYWSPWINNNGDIVYFASNTEGKRLMVVDQYGSVIRILEESITLAFWDNGASISDTGYVAFMGFKDAEKGIFVFHGSGNIVKVVPFDSPNTELKNFTTNGYPVMGNLGVTFRAEKKDNTEGIFWASNTINLTTIASNEGQSKFKSFFIPAINNSNDIVFGADIGGGMFGIYAASGGYTTIAETVLPPEIGEFATIDPSFTSVNNSGDVIFMGGKYGVQNGGGLFRKAFEKNPVHLNISDEFGGAFSPNINDNNNIAFWGSDQSGVTGIWVGPDIQNDKVIKVGDPLDGSIVSALALNPGNAHYFNNAGQVVFVAELENGLIGIYLANPLGPLPSFSDFPWLMFLPAIIDPSLLNIAE